jgi:uncharacterized protein
MPQLIRVDTSDDIIEEVMRVLRVRFEWSEESLKEAKSQMSTIGHKVTSDRRLDAVAEDPTDNRILECAVAASSAYVSPGIATY